MKNVSRKHPKMVKVWLWSQKCFREGPKVHKDKH